MQTGDLCHKAGSIRPLFLQLITPFFKMIRLTISFVSVLSLIVLSSETAAQGYVDQQKVAPLLNSQLTPVDSIIQVSWHSYEYYTDSSAKSKFFSHIDELPGVRKELRIAIIELANRKTAQHFYNGMQVIVPDSFPEDYKSYSPYPFLYSAADTLPKLFVIDKYTQTFAAYQFGKLVRWGILSSGSTNEKTPAGRYNFNWKAEYRLSNAAPPGEKWELYYLFNFQSKWGIHVHQYNLPIGKAVSHGCVRVSMSDAVWNYNWANEWQHDNGRLIRNGTPVIVIRDNPKDRPTQWNTTDEKVVSNIILPVNLLDVQAGLHATISTVSWFSGW